jgi:hypothetical protein
MKVTKTRKKTQRLSLNKMPVKTPVTPFKEE